MNLSSSPCLKNISVRRCSALKSMYGDGDTSAAGAAGTAVVPERTAGSARPPVLSAVERSAGARGLGSVLRSSVPGVLSREAGTAVACSGYLFPADDDRLF